MCPGEEGSNREAVCIPPAPDGDPLTLGTPGVIGVAPWVLPAHSSSTQGVCTYFAALNIGDSVERGFDTFFAWLPALLGALVVLIIGYFIAKFVAKLSTGLTRAGLDRNLLSGKTGGSRRSPPARLG